MDSDAHFMQLALDACRRGVEKGQTPFGASIVRGGEVLAVAHNHVWLRTDPSAHAEVCVIREACLKVGDIQLAGSTIYSTTEPCPMCFSAIHWSQIGRIVFGATIEDAARFGFNELPISNATMKKIGGAKIELTERFMRDEAVALFELWKATGIKAY